MEKGTLKHYDRYIASITNFASALDIEIVYKPYDDSAAWFPGTSKIIMDDNVSQTEEVASLLHELGHAVSDLFDTPDADIKAIEKAYGVIYKDAQVSAKNLSVVLATEHRAWNTGREIAKRLKIRLGKWYTDIEQECIEAYNE